MPHHDSPEWTEQLQLAEADLKGKQEAEFAAITQMQYIACGIPFKTFDGGRWTLFNVSQQSEIVGFTYAFESALNQQKRSGSPMRPANATAGTSASPGTGQEKRLLPFRPVWPGFAINTIFYAALLWVLWRVPGKIRRLVRIRRGCCPACGYKIAPGVGNKCSECGHALSPRRGAGV
jgi:hypothetical protein